MWKRFSRWVRSIFGGAVTSLENPEKILEQNIRDMTDQIPVINENIVTVKANLTLSENTLKKMADKEKLLREKIKSALSTGKRDMALDFAESLEQVQADIVLAEGNHEMAKKSLEKALRVKEAFMVERERKIKEAMRAINMAKQAEWQDKVARTMKSFEVADIDQTHDEMIRKIEEKVAKSHARMEIALDSKGLDEFEIEKDAQRRRADEIVRQFELEMGLENPEAAPTAKTLGPREKAPSEREPESESEKEAPAKSMGSEKVKTS